jgi:predicted acetyltransferase
MGVIPSQRRKGYAEELLIHMMNIGRMKGAKYATLQASDMGKRLYLKTGFQQDFIIKTFIKPQN